MAATAVLRTIAAITAALGIGLVRAQSGVAIAPPNLSGAVAGSLPGAARVDPTGAASYSIQLAVPPGTAGFAPAVGLVYSSQGGMSLSGQGWALSGLSSIARCGKTIEVDGNSTAVGFAADDQFCLDGKRLLFVPGSGTHGASAEYRTQIETFGRIRSTGTDSTIGPDSFRVEAKGGVIYTYGSTSDATVEAAGRSVRRAWALSRVEDRRGNYYTISYTENNAAGEHYPVQIRYTGNQAGALVPYNAVNFVYEARPDTWQDYLVGTPIAHTVRLRAVQTRINTAADGSAGTLVRDYRLTYHTNSTNGRSLVDALTDCDGAGNCLPSTGFTWTERTAASNNFSAPGSGVWGGPEAVYANMAHKRVWNSIAVVDMNGDGKTDLLKSLENGTWQVCLSTGSGFDCQIWSGPNKKMKDIQLGDFNGDGRTDIAYYDTIGHVCFSTGAGFNCQTASIAIGADDTIADFNGDGRDDSAFCYSQGDGTFVCDTVTTPGGMGVLLEQDAICPDEIQVRRNITGDFSGDGKVDYLVINMWSPSCPQGHVQSYQWGQFNIVNGGSQVGWVGVSAAGLPVVGAAFGRVPTPGSSTGRFNDDPYLDIVMQGLTGGAISLCKGTGAGFACTSPIVDTSQYDSFVYHVGDFDGDGRSDTIHFNPSNQARVCQVGGNGTYTCADWAGAAGPAQVYGDFNGDGKADIAYYNDTTKQWSIGLADGPVPDLLATVTNGVGHVTAFDYAAISDTNVYTAGADVPYPKRRNDSGTMVVSKIRVGNALGGWLTTSYKYAGQRRHLRGLGSLGFEKITSIDEVSQVSTITTYSQDFPNTGIPTTVDVVSAGGVKLSATTNTLASLSTTAGAKYPYTSTTVVVTKDLNGAAMTTSTTTVNAGGMDAYGNVTSSTQTVSDGTDSFSTTTVSTYDNLTTPWLIGLLRRSEVTKTAVQAGTTTTPPTLALTACSSATPTTTPVAATMTCTLANNGQTAASSIAYSSPAGTTRSGPASCAANTANCGTVTVTTGTAAATYSGTFSATPTPAGTAASQSVSLVVQTSPTLTLSSCTSTTPTISPTAATMSCTLGNTGQTAASSIAYSSPAGTTRSGPATCAANTANCGTVTVTTGTAAATYSGTFSATPTPAGTAASQSVSLVVQTSPTLTLSSCTSTTPTISPTAATMSCTLGNTGQTAASSIAYSSPAGTTRSGPATCAANTANCGTVTVTTGTAMGAYTGTLSATPTPAGTAASAGVSLAVNGSIATLTTASTSQTFGTVTQGSSSPTTAWTFRNDGNAAMTLAASALTSPFSWQSNSCTNIAPGNFCTLWALMSTATVGAFSQSGIGVSGAAQGNRSDLSLSGTVNASNTTLSVSPTSLGFGSVGKGLSRSMTLTLTNTGSITATGVVSLTFTYTSGTINQGQYANGGGTCASTLASGASCTKVIDYGALCTGGARNANLTLSGTNFTSLVVALTASTSSSGVCN